MTDMALNLLEDGMQSVRSTKSMPLMMELEDTTSLNSSESSESEFSEELEDDDDDGSSISSDGSGGYTTDCTTDSDSCNSFLEGVEQDFLASFGRDKDANAKVRESVIQRRASINALDMLQGVSSSNLMDRSCRSTSALLPSPKSKAAAKRNSINSIMDRMKNTKECYFQDPKAPVRRASDPSLALFSGSFNGGDLAAPLPGKVERSWSTGDLVESTGPVEPMEQSPEECLAKLLQGLIYTPTPNEYFLEIDAARLQRYSAAVARAVRAQDIDTLRSLHKEGVSFDACNSQGESLIHLACRRGNTDLLKFLIQEARVSLKVRDDWGKSPLHEQCWNGRPKKNTTCDTSTSFFRGVKLILVQEPELLFAKDQRSFCPLQYVPQEYWKEWCRFLQTNRVWIRTQVQFIGFARSRDQLRETLSLAEAALKTYSGAKKVSN